MLTRENLRSGVIAKLIEAQGITTWTDEQIAASIAQTLHGRDVGRGVWVFGYASLMWNPTFESVEHRLARVYGYHRRFCLWTTVGRGNEKCPGLMLGLEAGGSCRGRVFRIAPEVLEEELYLVWKREMVTGSYIPRWVSAETDAGPVEAVAFVINHAHERYAGHLDDAVAADAIAAAAGPLGPCCDYLFNTVRHLDELGIHDRRLHSIARLVEERQRRSA